MFIFNCSLWQQNISNRLKFSFPSLSKTKSSIPDEVLTFCFIPTRLFKDTKMNLGYNFKSVPPWKPGDVLGLGFVAKYPGPLLTCSCDMPLQDSVVTEADIAPSSSKRLRPVKSVESLVSTSASLHSNRNSQVCMEGLKERLRDRKPRKFTNETTQF